MTIYINHPTIDIEVNIPSNSHNKLIQILVEYFENSSSLRSQSKQTLKRKVTTVEWFYAFFIDIGYLELPLRDLPDSIFNVFANWCAERRTLIRGNGNGPRTRAVNLMGMVSTALEEQYGESWDFLDKVNFRRIKNNFNIQSRPSDKRQALKGLAGEECPYTDKQLFLSLRYVCAWLILEESRQKKVVLESDSIKALLSNLTLKHSPDELMTMHSFSHFNEIIKNAPRHPSHKESVSQLIKLANLINEVDDIYVKESFLRAMSSIQFKTLSESKIQKLSNRMVFHSKSYNHVYYEHSVGPEKGNRISPQFKRFTPFDLLYPSIASVISMINLLASERIQHSGLTKLTLDNVTINTNPSNMIKSLEVLFEKQRSNSCFSTIIYKSNDKNPLIYNAYKNYVDSMSSVQSLFPSEYRGSNATNKKSIKIKNKLLPQYRSRIFEGALYHIAEAIPFTLLADENSLLRKKINADIADKAEEYVAPFCWLLNSIINSRIGLRKNPELTKKTAKEKVRENLYLSTEYIGNSRVAFDRPNPVREIDGEYDDVILEKKPFTLNSSLSDISFLTAHNTDTKHNIYLDRLPEKERIDFIKSVPVRIAELMELDAMKLLELKKHNKVYTVSEAKKVLGLVNIDEIYLSIDEEFIGLDGEIKHGNDTLYIATKENASLILRHIEHYENEIPRLLQNHPEARGRIMDALLACYNLHLIIDKFPKDVLEKSREIASRLSCDLFPPLV